MKIFDYLIMIITWIIWWSILTYYIANDCMSKNIYLESYFYLSWTYCEYNICDVHYAEIYKKWEEIYVFDESTWNTWKKYIEYIKEQPKMKEWWNILITIYYYISKILKYFNL